MTETENGMKSDSKYQEYVKIFVVLQTCTGLFFKPPLPDNRDQ